MRPRLQPGLLKRDLDPALYWTTIARNSSARNWTNFAPTFSEKNALWLRYWRPTNWAFLNGDRVSQPSSRDDQDAAASAGFPAEVAAIRAG